MSDELKDEVRKVKEQSEAIDKTIETMLDRNAGQLKAAQRELSRGEKKYLEYFWNPKRLELRENVPLAVISFLEGEPIDPSLTTQIDARVQVDMLSLVRKGYIQDTGSGDTAKYKLTTLGAVYVTNKHPRLIVLWDALVARTPRMWRFAVGILAFIASVFGIIDFILHYGHGIIAFILHHLHR